jgi:hypothetical protein
MYICIVCVREREDVYVCAHTHTHNLDDFLIDVDRHFLDAFDDLLHRYIHVHDLLTNISKHTHTHTYKYLRVSKGVSYLHIQMCVCLWICAYMCMYVYVFNTLSLSLSLCLSVSLSLNPPAAHVSAQDVLTYTHMFTYVHTCTYMYTHIYTKQSAPTRCRVHALSKRTCTPTRTRAHPHTEMGEIAQ